METFTIDQVAQHNKESDAYIVYKGVVADVTTFLDTHPGGKEYLLPYLGKDCTSAFKEANHSEVAVNILYNHAVGKLEDAETIEIASPRFDYTKGMIYQVWSSMSLQEYKELANGSMHLKGHVRLFDNPFLEIFTMTYWWIIPIFWLPVSWYLLTTGSEVTGWNAGMIVYVIGIAWWTLLEYILHRFMFHCEERIPDNRWCITFHFLVHGIHHAFPADDMRLVFPPVAGCILASLVKSCYNCVMPVEYSDILMGGTILGYIVYDCLHYFIHHKVPSDPYTIYLKAYHMHHHYKNPYRGFGVSNKIWDIVFDTELPVTYAEALKYAKLKE
jgi:4-hydroxysphinganine ceramide fatty acyl 2-hydroxylase